MVFYLDSWLNLLPAWLSTFSCFLSFSFLLSLLHCLIFQIHIKGSEARFHVNGWSRHRTTYVTVDTQGAPGGRGCRAKGFVKGFVLCVIGSLWTWSSLCFWKASLGVTKSGSDGWVRSSSCNSTQIMSGDKVFAVGVMRNVIILEIYFESRADGTFR